MRLGSVLSHIRMGLYRLSGKVDGIEPGAFVHHSVEISQCRPWQIAIVRGAVVASDVWLNVPEETLERRANIRIGAGARIGRRCMISSKNQVTIGENCILSPHVLIMDHAHRFDDISRPILDQGLTEGGTITIEAGCWIGFGAAVICNRGELRIGRNSVVAANSVVTRSVPALSIVAGAPAQIIRQYDGGSQRWARVAGDDGHAERISPAHHPEGRGRTS